MNRKPAYLIAGVIFLIRAVYTAYIMLMYRYYLYLPMIPLLFQVFNIVIPFVLGVTALRGKDRRPVLNILAYVYFFIAAYNIFSTAGFGVSRMIIRSLISLALVVFAFIISNSKSTLFAVKDTVSEAAKHQIQSEKQTSIYDEQLRDGIITQEEYDQIMENRKA